MEEPLLLVPLKAGGLGEISEQKSLPFDASE